MRRNKPTPMPMKLFAIFGLLAILSSSLFGSTISTVQAQEPTPPAPNGEVQPLAENGSSLYYYVDGKRVNLTPSLDWVSVKFVSADASEQEAVTGKFSSTVTSLSGARQIPHLGVTLLPVKDGLAAKSLVQGVNSMRASSSSFSQVNPVFAYDSMDMVVSDEFVAAFPPAASMAEINEINAARGVELVSEVLGQENTFVLQVTSAASLDALAMANHYQESGLVVYASPNFVRISAASPAPSTEKPGTIGPMFTPDDSYYANDQWYLNGTGQYGTTVDADIDAPEAWNITTGDPSVVIAIIDEGVDITHPELTGLAKLVTGYDATGTGPAGGAPAANSDDAHGTAAAGIAAAASNNASGISGVCQLCKIMPVRIAYGNGAGGWVTTDTWIANGITWAYQNGADVLSNSWGGGLPVTVVNTAITNAVTLGRGGTGAVVVFAAGNENNSSVSWPASQSNVIAVGALNICDHRKDPNTSDSCNGGEGNWGSNFGSALDVMAAGMWLTTTDIVGDFGYSDSSTPVYGADYDGYFNGTSGATPIVSGVAGLLLSINPFMTPAHVQEVLQTTADDLGVAGRDNDTGYGRVNAFKALTLAQKPDLVITGYEFRNAANNAVITNLPSGDAFYIRLKVHNRGGSPTGTFYPGVFLDDKPNYGADLDTPDLGRFTDFQGYRISPSNSSFGTEAGCLYYDPTDSIDPLVDVFQPERGNYTRSQFNDSIDANGDVTSDVYIGYSDTEFFDPIYDSIRLGLADGSYQIYLYADGNCSGGAEEGYENNNSFGPISVAIGELPSGPTTVDVTISGTSRGTYPMNPDTSIVTKYILDGGPVVISSNNGVGLIASLSQQRRRPGTTAWTGVSQSMALPVEQISNQYVIPRYDYTSPTTKLNQILIANVDNVTRDITITIGGVVKGVYTLAPAESKYIRYTGLVGGPVVVSSVVGAKIVASLYELVRDPALSGWNGQSEMMGLPWAQISDQYLIPQYFGASSPNTLVPSLYIGVP